MDLSRPITCIVGPTASGKSDLAQNVAEAINAEIVSADSMQVYRGMDIGTGKIPRAERRVVHHGLDLVDPGQPYSAALFQTYSRSCFADIDERGSSSILCGGTGFYVRAAIDGYEFPPGDQVNNEVRNHYSEFADTYGRHELWLLLEQRDPASAAIISENDVKRVVRAFELLEEGKSYARQRENLPKIEQVVPATMVGLDVDPAILRERIDLRIKRMFAEGLVDEVRGLLEQGFRDGVTSPQAIGYKEVVRYLDGQSTKSEAFEAIRVATHRYAKRQRTWFRKDARIHWIDASSLNLDDMTERVLAIVDKIDATRKEMP